MDKFTVSGVIVTLIGVGLIVWVVIGIYNVPFPSSLYVYNAMALIGVIMLMFGPIVIAMGSSSKHR